MWGYGIGAAGQGSSYKFMSSYFVLFLTDCVLFEPSTASLIASLALWVEAIVGMIVGNISDRFPSKMGRRRPFILITGIFMPIVLILIMLTPQLTLGLKIAYYLVLAILFRALFSFYEIPYNALGADIAKNYDDRIKLRSISRTCGVLGNIIGYILPIVMLKLLENNKRVAWAITGFLIAVSVFISLVGCTYLTKGKDPVYTSSEKEKKHNVVKDIIKNYYELLKLKPMRTLIAYKALVASALALFDVGMIYYINYSLCMNTASSLITFFAQALIFLVMTPVINYLALKLGKALQQEISFIILGVVGVIVFLFFPKNTVAGFIYIIIFAVVQTGFWQISSSIFYDCVEVDQWVNKKRRQGDIMSLISVLGTIITAIMVQLFGILLQLSGYNTDTAVQSSNTILFLNIEYILVPSILGILAAVSLHFQPITKQRFESLQRAIALREEGKNFSEYIDDIAKIID